MMPALHPGPVAAFDGVNDARALLPHPCPCTGDQSRASPSGTDRSWIAGADEPAPFGEGRLMHSGVDSERYLLTCDRYDLRDRVEQP